jgi:hypothetical protein
LHHRQGLESIDVEDAAVAAAKATSVRAAPVREVESEAEVISSRKRISIAPQKPARKKHQQGEAKTKASSPRESRPETTLRESPASTLRAHAPGKAGPEFWLLFDLFGS